MSARHPRLAAALLAATTSAALVLAPVAATADRPAKDQHAPADAGPAPVHGTSASDRYIVVMDKGSSKATVKEAKDQARGKGATVQWTSQVKSVGNGSMEITESEPSRHIDLAVIFNGLDGASSYDISPSGSGSKVTWAFGYDSGTSPLKRWKALMLDGFVGAEYRAGLDRLKEKIEAERRPTAPTVSETPPGGISTESEQPSAALPPGAVPQQGAAVAPGQPAPAAGAAAPAAGAAQTGSTTTAPAAAEVTPTPAPKPPKKKKRNP